MNAGSIQNCFGLAVRLFRRREEAKPRPTGTAITVPASSVATSDGTTRSGGWEQPRLVIGLIYLLLAAATVTAYARVGGFNFLNYDDFYIFFGNQEVRGGLTSHGLAWGLTTTYYEYWHPLMWWSHMLDWELFGRNPAGHHWMSLGLHVANTLLLFAVWKRMTGMVWRSAIVAALFGLHPLHVESVAWLAERKDVLSAFFALGCVWSYACYAGCDSKSGGRQGNYYALALAFFTLGLLTKPMVVTLPFVLLLLDYWPLKRNADCEMRIAESKNAGVPWLALVREKVPFFALTFVFCVVTWWTVKASDHIRPSETLPWSVRLPNIPVSYAGYLRKTLWPTDLAVLYPLPNHWEWWLVSMAVVVLLLITWVVLGPARRFRYAAFGWLMFLGILVPTIGLVPVGLQAMADRYMYLPSIGLFVAVVWAVADISARWQFRKLILASVTVPILAACGWLTWVQTGHWRDSLSLWTHCLAVAPESALAHYNLAATYLDLGRPAEAIVEYRAALRLKPDDADANLNLGAALTANGMAGEATNYFAKVLQLRPGDSKARMNMALALAGLGDFEGALAHCNRVIAADPMAYGAYTCRGRILSAQGKSDEAIKSYLEALRVNASNYETLYHLGMEYLKQGKTEGAIPAFRKAQELDPTNPLAHVLLAAALDMAHRTGDAVPEYREALRLRPDWPEALNNLAWILATHPDEKLRNGAEAVQLAARACDRTGGQQAVFVGTLAAAFAEVGQFDKAVEIAQKACDLAAARGDLELVKRNQDLLELFRNHKAYREGK